ncbi:acyl-CoA dehydrogenase [Streptomyces griseocarneus]|uniref:acyl-CoA dehydrogenase n=1 Tax=Streptomyces griseocarneus TaxID=51201 RepID=UPI00167C836B|nr:acyl-CoA dehydrogenase [Streptomyces griseocarneus]MBZ6476483.1 acyl-CoA dehydrogenase [Streptomyces griseocarneus]GHG78678.1 oxidoreductase [Streptomyces griseocarneus]
MRFLECERATVAKLLPGLDESLRAMPLRELENPSGPGIELFRDSGGPGLLVPAARRGRGATALEALRVQRALGGRAPSLAAATALHHFSVAVLLAQAATEEGLWWMLAEEMAVDNRLVAFGFAEERADAGILAPATTATVEPDGLRVGGVTCPRGLARSMDLLATGVMVPRLDGEPGEEPAVALVSAESESLSIDGAGTDGERVTLHDVLVPPELLVTTPAPDGQPDPLTAGFAWFQLLTTGGCLGAADAMVERVLRDDRVPESERVGLLVEVEGAMSAAQGVARRIDDGDTDESTLAHALYVRYSVQDTLSRVVPRAVELLGDLDSTTSDEVSRLAGCANGLALHPPARDTMTGALVAYLIDGPLTIA